MSRGITLVESDAPEHESLAGELLSRLQPASRTALRIGVSGAPGVGKSTLLEALGLCWIAGRRRVAILAVDPSSRISGGSILGDKTRMDRLSRAPEAFIRPTPGGSWSGGVARRTREAILLCEAAGYDLVCVETIGVGQAELAVADLTDCVLLLLLAQAGDELQGIKRGILEVADLVVIHKADGDGLAAAERARDDYAQALRLLRGEAGAPTVLCASARSGRGVEELAARLLEFGAPARAAARDQRRRRQAVVWFDEGLRERLLARLQQQPEIAGALAATRARVAAGTLDPRIGIEQLLGRFAGS